MSSLAIKLLEDDRLASDLVVVGCFEKSSPELGSLERRFGAAVRRAVEQPGWKGGDKQIVRAVTRGSKPVQLEVHGLGASSKFTAVELSRWLDRVVNRLREEGRRDFTLLLPSHKTVMGRACLHVLLRLQLAAYEFDRYKSQAPRNNLRTIHLQPPDGAREVYGRALGMSRVLARGVSLARDLANTPPVAASPEWIAEHARALAEEWDMDCQILGPAELETKGMGGILAVGGGSVNPPRLVRLEWGEGKEVVSLVGKGVTFDTGGLSIKPSRGMEEMKYDKCGACTVLGIAKTAAELALPVRFRAYLPLAENMPDGASYRPGDIVRCYNGKSVEILDTDAEGRMILADALAWAAEEKPDFLLEYSTLTGASVVALGHHGAALYTPEESLAAELMLAADSSGERLWRMPLWPEFSQEMKGVHADLRNLGSRWGGANSAAAFLASFVGRIRRWAHLDIAATAYVASRETQTSAATGFGVALTTDWLLSRTGTF